MAEEWTAQQRGSALDAHRQALSALWDEVQPEVERRMASGPGPGQMPPDVGPAAGQSEDGQAGLS